MDIGAINGSSSAAAIVRQLQTVSTIQTAVMRQIVDSQRQMAALLAEAGLGQIIDIHA